MALIPEPQGFVRNPLTENLDANGYNLENASILSATVIETETLTAIPPVTKIDVEETLNFRPGHELEFAGDGDISLTGLKMNPQAGTTTNVLNLNAVNDRITYEAFPAGDWYNYPAISAVNMAGYDLQDISLLTRPVGANTDTASTSLIYEDNSATGLIFENSAGSLASLRMLTGTNPSIEFRIPLSGLFADQIRIEAPLETGTPANDGDILRYNGSTHQWVNAINYSFGAALSSPNITGGSATHQVIVGKAGTPNIGFTNTPSARNTAFSYKDSTYTWRSQPVVQYRVRDMFPMDTYDTTSILGYTTSTFGYWGSVLMPNGIAVLIPFNNTQIGLLNTENNTFTVAGAPFASGGSKWCGGVLAANGLVYCAPHGNANILIINPALDPANPAFYTLLPCTSSTTTRWRGCCTDVTGRYVVFNPSSEPNVMILDTTNNALTYINTTFGTAADKYATCSLAPNGLIYHAPNGRTAAGQAVGITNVTLGTFTTFGTIPAGQNNISRSAVLYGTNIYCPVRSGTNLFYIIDTVANTLTGVGGPITANALYAGAILAADEKIYCYPHKIPASGNADLMIIDPITNTASFRTLATGLTPGIDLYIDGTTNVTGTKTIGISFLTATNCAIIRTGVPKLQPWVVTGAFNKY